MESETINKTVYTFRFSIGITNREITEKIDVLDEWCCLEDWQELTESARVDYLDTALNNWIDEKIDRSWG
jgi:hypothetical protein